MVKIYYDEFDQYKRGDFSPLYNASEDNFNGVFHKVGYHEWSNLSLTYIIWLIHKQRQLLSTE